MVISRWIAAVAVSALVLVGIPGTAVAGDECEPHDGLLGLSLDDCGLRATILGVDVQLGGTDSGDDSGSGSEEPAEPEPADPAEDGAAGSDGGSGDSADRSTGDERDDTPGAPSSRTGGASDGSGDPQNLSGSSGPTVDQATVSAPADPAWRREPADGPPGASSTGRSDAAGQAALDAAARGAEPPTDPAVTAQHRGPLAGLPGMSGSFVPDGWMALGLLSVVLFAAAAVLSRRIRRRPE
jgi:hypothetical protein